MQQWERWNFSFDDRMPIYRQIILQFNRAFVRGDIQAGERIPSIRELSALLQVNTNTIQRVYQEMERDGLIGSKRGTGYFMTEEKGMIGTVQRLLAESSLRCFLQEMRALGMADNEIMEELETFMKGERKSGTNS